jgi:hypothetical protein
MCAFHHAHVVYRVDDDNGLFNKSYNTRRLKFYHITLKIKHHKAEFVMFLNFIMY